MSESSSKGAVSLVVLMSDDCVVTGTCIEDVDVGVHGPRCTDDQRAGWLLDQVLAVVDRTMPTRIKFHGSESVKNDIVYRVNCDVIWLNENDPAINAFVAEAQRQINSTNAFDVAKSFGLPARTEAESASPLSTLTYDSSMTLLTSFKSYAASLVWTEAVSCGHHKNGNSQQGAQWVHKGLAEIDLAKWLAEYNAANCPSIPSQEPVTVKQAEVKTASIYVVGIDEFQLVYGYTNQHGAIITGVIFRQSNYATVLSRLIHDELSDCSKIRLIFSMEHGLFQPHVMGALIREFDENDYSVNIQVVTDPSPNQSIEAGEVYAECVRVHRSSMGQESPGGIVLSRNPVVGVKALLDAVAASHVPVPTPSTVKVEEPTKCILDGVTALGKVNSSDFDPSTVRRIWVSAAHTLRQYIVVQTLGELVARYELMAGDSLVYVVLRASALAKSAYDGNSRVHVIVNHRGFGPIVARRIQLECGSLAHVEMTTDANDYPEMLARVVFDGANQNEIKQAEAEDGVPGRVYFAPVSTEVHESTASNPAVVAVKVEPVVVERQPLIDENDVFDRCNVMSSRVTSDALAFVESRLLLDWTEFDANTQADLKRIALDVAHAFVANRSPASSGGVDGYKMLEQAREHLAEVNARYAGEADEIRALRGLR